jgi:hypothetical protein
MTSTPTPSTRPTPPMYGNLLQIVQRKTIAQLLHDLQTNSDRINSYVTELNTIIANGTIPNAPDNIYTPLPNKPIAYTSINQKRLETTTDVANDDTNQLLFHQNTMYIMGTITCATLIISAIFFARDR